MQINITDLIVKLHRESEMERIIDSIENRTPQQQQQDLAKVRELIAKAEKSHD